MSSQSVLACLAVLGGLMLPNAALAQMFQEAQDASERFAKESATSESAT